MRTDELLSRIAVHRWLPLSPPGAPRPCGHPVFWVYIAPNHAHGAVGRVGLGLGSHCPMTGSPSRSGQPGQPCPTALPAPVLYKEPHAGQLGRAQRRTEGNEGLHSVGALLLEKRGLRGTCLVATDGQSTVLGPRD